MSTPGDGLVRPLNAPPAGLAVPGTQPGVQGGVVLARYVIVNGAGDGVFVYSGAPGLGNPPIAWMGSGLVDPYGNVLPSTTGVADTGTFQAGNTIITPDGIFFYSGTPAAGNLAYSITITNVTDPFGTTTGIGFCSYAVGYQASLTAGKLNFGTTSGSTLLFANANGTMAAQTAPGYAGTIPLTGVDSAIHTVTQASMNPLSDAWPVPAGDASALTAYTLEVDGSGETGTTQETLSFEVAAFGGTFCAFTIGGLQFPVSTNFAWSLSFKIVFISATRSSAGPARRPGISPVLRVDW